jgi:hypothetical protein
MGYTLAQSGPDSEFNDAFEIVLFGTWMARHHRELLAERMPLTLENRGGSLWLRRRQRGCGVS